MLALVTIFLTTLLIAVVVVRLYRTISGWQGFGLAVMGRESNTTHMTLKAQQGYISLIAASRQKAKPVRLRSPKGGIKTPWGW